MARSYAEASSARRAHLPVAERSDGAVFDETYRLSVQVTEQRELRGLTQTDLAEKTGIDQGDTSRIERGSIFPNEKTLLRLADGLGAEWRLVDKATARIRLYGRCPRVRRSKQVTTPENKTRSRVARSPNARAWRRRLLPAPCASGVMLGRPLL
jgi:transcriptional regulator with XRE-family HTH domain